jgi:Mrp family chromosome partitioning ATPase
MTMPNPLPNGSNEPNDVVAIGDLAQRASASRSIARMAESRALTTRELETRRMIHRDENSPEATNAFREIRTRLLALGGAHNFVTMVTPVSPKSGGSFVARNLAAAFAFDEAKTALLLDCNLRHPAQHKALGLEADHGGLIDYLEKPEAEIQEVFYRTGIPRLRLIPAGRPREMSTEYFSSQRMRTLIDSLRHRYADRYIFLDGPAMKGAPDARILSDLADYVVVVAAYGRDTAAAIGQAVATIEPEKLAGVVFNHTP